MSKKNPNFKEVTPTKNQLKEIRGRFSRIGAVASSATQKYYTAVCPHHGELVIGVFRRRKNAKWCHECEIADTIGLSKDLSTDPVGAYINDLLTEKIKVVEHGCSQAGLPFHRSKFVPLMWFLTIMANFPDFKQRIKIRGFEGRPQLRATIDIMNDVIGGRCLTECIKVYPVLDLDANTKEFIALLLANETCKRHDNSYFFNNILVNLNKLNVSYANIKWPDHIVPTIVSAEPVPVVSHVNDVTTEPPKPASVWVRELINSKLNFIGPCRTIPIDELKHKSVGFYRNFIANLGVDTLKLDLTYNTDYSIFEVRPNPHHLHNELTFDHPIMNRYFVAFNYFREVSQEVIESFCEGYRDDNTHGMEKAMVSVLPYLCFVAQNASRPLTEDARIIMTRLLGENGISAIGSRNGAKVIERNALRDNLASAWRELRNYALIALHYFNEVPKAFDHPYTPKINKNIYLSDSNAISWFADVMNRSAKILDMTIQDKEHHAVVAVNEAINALNTALDARQKDSTHETMLADFITEQTSVIYSISEVFHQHLHIHDFLHWDKFVFSPLCSLMHPKTDDVMGQTYDIPTEKPQDVMTMTDANGVTEEITLSFSKDSAIVIETPVVVSETMHESVTPNPEPKKFFQVREVDDTNLNRIMSVVYGFYRHIGIPDYSIMVKIDEGCHEFIEAVEKDTSVSEDTKKIIRESLFSSDISEEMIIELSNIGINSQEAFKYLLRANTDKNPLRAWRVWQDVIKDISAITGISEFTVSYSMLDIVLNTNPNIKKVFLQVHKK